MASGLQFITFNPASAAYNEGQDRTERRRAQDLQMHVMAKVSGMKIHTALNYAFLVQKLENVQIEVAIIILLNVIIKCLKNAVYIIIHGYTAFTLVGEV